LYVHIHSMSTVKFSFRNQLNSSNSGWPQIFEREWFSSSRKTVNCFLLMRRTYTACKSLNGNGFFLLFYFTIIYFLKHRCSKSTVTDTWQDLKKYCLVWLSPVVRTWDQEVCSLCGLRFEPCGCSYDGHWRLTWSLTSGPVGLVEVHASWPRHLP
jgi:hypothetical protein